MTYLNRISTVLSVSPKLKFVIATNCCGHIGINFNKMRVAHIMDDAINDGCACIKSTSKKNFYKKYSAAYQSTHSKISKSTPAIKIWFKQN